MSFLKAGTYYLGDPCYAIANKQWGKFTDKTIGERKMGVTFEITINGKTGQCWADYTAYGDGGYDGSDGVVYGVDSGSIGLVPVELMENPEDFEDGSKVEAPYGLTAWSIDGCFCIDILGENGIAASRIEIETGDGQNFEDSEW